MEPQTPQTSSAGSQLDPQAVNLAKAIRQTESGGNFAAKGKSGEYGAYQFMPKTWESMAKNAGINVPLEQSTPEQQNEVAYKQIKIWKDEGKDPGQIASLWNSGDPNAYLGEFSSGEPSVGKNKMGVEYNVPQYAEKVASAYQSLKGENPASQPQPQESQPKSFWDNISDFAKQVYKSGSVGIGGVNALETLPTGLAITGLASAPKSVLPIAATAASIVGGPEAGLAVEGIGKTIENIAGDSKSESAPQQPTQAPVDTNFGQQDAQHSAATDAVKNAILSTLQGTQSNRNFSQSQHGQDAVNTAAAFGLIEPDENGNLVFNDEKQRQALDEISSLHDKIIGANGGEASPVSVLNETGNYLGKDRLLDPTSKKEAAEKIQGLFEDDRAGIPTNGQMSLAMMRERQKQHYKAAENAYKKANYASSPEQIAHKALGHAYGSVIRENMADKELYDRTKLMESHLINAKQLGKKLSGKKAPTNKGVWESFLKQGARAAEIYIGEKLGGPIGAIIGGFAGEHLNRKIEKKFGRNIFETPGMVAALDTLRDTKPKEYTQIVDSLKKQGIEITKEAEKDPDTKKELIKDVQDNLATMKGKKGLVKLKR